jgi:predicted aspartyl protease
VTRIVTRVWQLRAWILVLIAFASPAGAQPVDCTLQRVAQLEVTDDKAGNPMIPVRLNGRAVFLIVDTGGVFSSLSSELVEDLKLPEMPIDSYSVRSIGGAAVPRMVKVSEFGIGSITAKDIHFLSVPRTGSEWDGVLAPDLLRNFDVEFDPSTHTISLYKPHPCAGTVVYWTKAGYTTIRLRMNATGQSVFDVTLDGKALGAVLDSGSSVSWTNRSAAEDLFGSVGELTSDNKAAQKAPPSAVHEFKELSFGGVTVSSPNIELLPNPLAPSTQIIVGTTIMRRLHLYIAYRERVLYVTAADAH